MYQVLFVEDETAVREGIINRIQWEEFGFQLVGACEHGEEALDLLRQQPVELLITDINMPVMDGLELSKHVHKNWPETKIVIVSGYDNFEYAQRAIRYQVSDYVLKPVTAKELGTLLNQIKRELDAKLPHVEKAWSVMRDQFLKKLMKGPMPKEEAEARAQEFAIETTDCRHCVVLVSHVSQTNEHLLNVVKNAEHVEAQLVAEAVGHTTLLCSGHHPKYSMARILGKVNKQPEQLVTAVIGCEVDHLGEVHESYTQANKGRQHMYRMSPGQVCVADELINAPERKPKTSGLRYEVLQSLRLFNREETHEALNEYTENLRDSTLTRNQILESIGKLISLLDEFAEQYKVAFMPDALARLNEKTDLDGAHDFLQQLIDELMDSCEDQWHSVNKQGVLAVEYIKQNYHRSDLALADITDFLSVSTSYFSTIFKEHTGMTFVEFLTQLRMERAQELVVATDQKNYEIAHTIGYEDPGYFQQLFKKNTGYTPTEYRKLKR